MHTITHTLTHSPIVLLARVLTRSLPPSVGAHASHHSIHSVATIVTLDAFRVSAAVSIIVYHCYPKITVTLATLAGILQATEAVKEAEEEAGWNLEDEAGFDDDKEEEQQAQPSAKPAAELKPEEGAMDLEEGGDEIDPLDAFMADNEAQVGPIKTEEDATAAPQGDCHSQKV